MTTTDALASGEPQQVADALDQLKRALPPRPPEPAPPPEVLDAFPDGPPGAVVADYIWVLAHYQPLVPPLPADERVRWWVEAVLRSGDGAAALQVAMYLESETRPPGADLAAAVRYVADRGVGPGREEQGAEYLARYLLDRSGSYVRSVVALATWRGRPRLDGVLGAVGPYVRPEDRAALGL